MKGWDFETTQVKVKIKYKKEVTSMKLENINKDNLKEATKKAKEEIMNEEIEYAMGRYRYATDKINSVSRRVKELEESKKPYQEILDQFK